MSSLEMRQSLYGFEMAEPDLRRSERGSVHDIKQLWQRSHEIIGLALQGVKQKKIAEILDISPVTVSNTLNSPIGMKKLSRLRKARDEENVKVSEEVARLAEKAIAVYEDILDSETASLSLKKDTADTVLMDLGGHRAPTKLDSRHLNITATKQEIEEFKRRGIKAAIECGMPIMIPDKFKDEVKDRLKNEQSK